MTLTEDIRRLIESLQISSSAGDSPKINRVLAIDEIPDLDAAVRDSEGLDPDLLKEKKKTSDAVETVADFKSGNVGELQRLSSAQMGNLKGIAANPFLFLTRGLIGKLVKGAGILFLVELARTVADIILNEFFKPGRIFDTRFRQQIDNQVVVFLNRKEQQELKQGFKQVITTTIGGLRGNTLAGQIGGNFQNPERIPDQFLDQRRVSLDNVAAQDVQDRSNGGLYFGLSRQRNNI